MEDKLSDRQQVEKNYHDKKYKGDLSVSDTRESNAYKFFRELIGDVRGLRVLDYGCGTGWMGVALAKAGAEVYGIDISEELVNKALQLAEREGLAGKIYFQQMPAEDLRFADLSFDLIVGSAILHHIDIPLAMKSFSRVLKPNGKAVFIEPMNQNIILKLWRMLTPWRRSPAERALTVPDLKSIRAVFPESKFYFFTFLSIFTDGLLTFFPRNAPIRFLDKMFERVDGVILKSLPPLGKYSAVVVMELQKKKALPGN